MFFKKKKKIVKATFYLEEDRICFDFDPADDISSFLLMIEEICSGNIKNNVYKSIANKLIEQGKEVESMVAISMMGEEKPVVSPTKYPR
jgi:hypothetical protein